MSGENKLGRYSKIDNMRAIGLLLIFLAHANAPEIVNSFRCYDVVLLVFISNYICNPQKICDKEKFWGHVKKRALKILLPTYIFVVIYSVIQFVAYKVAGRAELFGMRQIINSLLLCEDSVGYVWIMKVYFLNFLLLPLMYNISDRMKTFWKKILTVAVLIVAYLFLLLCYKTIIPHNYYSWVLIEEWLICIFAYSLVGLDAVFAKTCERWEKYGCLFWGFLLFITIALGLKTGVVFNPAAGKRPPNLQYISFGLVATHLLKIIVPNTRVRILEWISKESLGLYLLHPIFVLGLNTINSIKPGTIFSLFEIKWCVITVCSCCTLWLCLNIVKRVHTAKCN